MKKNSANEVNLMQTNKTLPTICSILAVLGLAGSAFAQGSNDFFGSSVLSPASPGSSGAPIERPPGVAAAEQQALKAGSTDLTQDEKRMQKKYNANMHAASDLACIFALYFFCMRFSS